MKDTRHLYGDVDVPLVPPEFRALRLLLLRKHLTLLLKESGAVGTTRVNDVVKAISFWEKLS